MQTLKSNPMKTDLFCLQVMLTILSQLLSRTINHSISIMKRLFLILLPFLFTTILRAQDTPPQAVCYQAVATDVDGRELMGATLTIRASILEGSPTGVVVYQETHQVTTDDFGLFTINIGERTLTGTHPFS